MCTRTIRVLRLAFLLLVFRVSAAGAQEAPAPAGPAEIDKRLNDLEKKVEAQRFTYDTILKKIDDVLWFERVGDVADIDKIYYTSVPNPKEEETYGIQNARHPFRAWAYV